MASLKEQFDTIRKNNGVLGAQIIQNAGLLGLQDIDHILEFAGKNPEEIRGLLPYLQAKYSLNTGEYEIPVNFIVRDGQIMRYYNNYVFNEFGHHWDCYFGIDCYSVNDTIVKIDKNSEIIFDFLVLNTKTGELLDPGNLWKEFTSGEYQMLSEIFYGKKIQIKNEKDKRLICANGKHIATIQGNQAIELTLPGVKKIQCLGRFFYNMEELNLPDAESLGRIFPETANDTLKIVKIPQARIVGGSFLRYNHVLTGLDAPMLEAIGYQALEYNNSVTRLNAPLLERVGDGSDKFPEILASNTVLKELNAPKLEIKQPKNYSRLHEIVEKNMAQNTRNA